MNKNTEIAFTPQSIDAAYINALTDFVNLCRELNVKIDTVSHFQHGWIVTFEGYDGDAICHSGSYGSPCPMGLYNPEVERNDWNDHSGRWETLGFPWDYEDVSVHTAEELAQMLHALNEGRNIWDEEEE